MQLIKINKVISFWKYHNKLSDTSKKEYLNMKEGGNDLELTLFGKVTKNLSYGEALYVLNENNYGKSLIDFRKGFEKLLNQDLIIKGQFDEFNLKNKSKINEYKNIFIKFKNDNSFDENDIFNNVNINIPLRNDIIGRYYDLDDLNPFF